LVTWRCMCLSYGFLWFVGCGCGCLEWWRTTTQNTLAPAWALKNHNLQTKENHKINKCSSRTPKSKRQEVQRSFRVDSTFRNHNNCTRYGEIGECIVTEVAHSGHIRKTQSHIYVVQQDAAMLHYKYFLYICIKGRRDSAVVIATGYGMDDWGVRVRVPVGTSSRSAL
jgi:hypothetical protein